MAANRTSTRRNRRPVAAGILVAAALVSAPLAVAGTGDSLREGARNGTTVKETEIIGNQTAKVGKGGFVTRQSNINGGANAGGAAVYGCRAPVGGTSAGSAPCLRASNLAGGNAFEFATSNGVAGLFSVGDPNVPNPGKPFTTNATGVATGLNADKIDGKDASELTGAPGPAGPAGPAGPVGPRGPSDLRHSLDTGIIAVPTCATANLATCPSILTRSLTGGSWLVQAKLVVDNNGGAASSTNNRCGLVVAGTLRDEARNSLGANSAVGQNESVALTAVVTEPGASTVGLRCTEQGGETLQVEDAKITAVQVETVTGP